MYEFIKRNLAYVSKHRNRNCGNKSLLKSNNQRNKDKIPMLPAMFFRQKSHVFEVNIKLNYTEINN